MYQLATLTHLLTEKYSPGSPQKLAHSQSTPTAIDCPNTQKQVEYKQ